MSLGRDKGETIIITTAFNTFFGGNIKMISINRKKVQNLSKKEIQEKGERLKRNIRTEDVEIDMSFVKIKARIRY